MDCTVAVSVADRSGAEGVAAGEGGAVLAALERNRERQRIKRGASRPMPRVMPNLLEGGPGEPPTAREPSRREAIGAGYRRAPRGVKD
jgi:hypothetical protein